MTPILRQLAPFEPPRGGHRPRYGQVGITSTNR